MRVEYAIVFVSDMPRSVRFYRDTLGLPLRFESTHWTEFATGGATLALHLADPAQGAAPAGNQVAGSCRPGLQVDDLDAFHVTMTERGVTCAQEPKDVGPSRVAQYLDPDGLAISVGEHREL